jgi:hypothetical protein
MHPTGLKVKPDGYKHDMQDRKAGRGVFLALRVEVTL